MSKVWPVIDRTDVWVFTRTSSGKVRRIAENSSIALMFESGSETYLYGDAELVDDLAAKQRLWSRADLPFDPAMFFGSADHPDHTLVHITPIRAVVTTHGADGFQQHLYTA